MKHKMFLLSIDALVVQDIEKLKKLKNFNKLMKNCSGAESVNGVYPSVTYVAHASIMTGCFPGKHGITENSYFQTQDTSTHWIYDSKELKVETIFDAAKKKGLTTASVYWPVTGRLSSVDYNLNEYWFPKKEEEIDPIATYKNQGADEITLKAVEKCIDRYPKKYRDRKGMLTKQNTYDDLIIGVTCELLKEQKPDVTFAHICFIDSIRHKFGVFNEYVDEGLKVVDDWLGQLIEALETVSPLCDFDIVILSDHGQMDYRKRTKINALLVEGGFISLNEDGSVGSWKAFATSNALSATIYLNDKNDKVLFNQVYEYLKEIQKNKEYGIGEILTVDQSKEHFGNYGDFSFMVETDSNTSFSQDWHLPISAEVNLEDYRLGPASHGAQPQKGPQPVFLVNGPSFKKNFFISQINLVDEAPTLAKVLETTLSEAEGRVLNELLS